MEQPRALCDTPLDEEQSMKDYIPNPVRVRKGEIWDTDAGRFRVIHATAKTVKLRRLSNG